MKRRSTLINTNLLESLRKDLSIKALRDVGVAPVVSSTEDYQIISFKLSDFIKMKIIPDQIKFFYESKEIRSEDILVQYICQYILGYDSLQRDIIQKYKERKEKEEVIDILRKKVWMKSTGSDTIQNHKFYYKKIIEDIKAVLDEETTLNVDTIRNFIEKRNYPRVETLNILARYVLEDAKGTFSTFEIENKVKFDKYDDLDIPNNTDKDMLRFDLRLLLFLPLIMLFIYIIWNYVKPTNKVLITFATSLNTKSITDKKNNSTDFWNLVVNQFNAQNKKYQIEVIKNVTRQSEPSFIRSLNDDGRFGEDIDFLLGGGPELHHPLKSRKIDFNKLDNDLPEWAKASDSRWVGIYTGFPGIIYNCNLWNIADDTIQFSKLDSYAFKFKEIGCGVPELGQYSGSLPSYLLYLFGLKIADDAEGEYIFDFDKAFSQYEKLSRNAKYYDRKVNHLDLVSNGQIAFGIYWMHDEFWRNKYLADHYPNIRALIPNDALLYMGCASVFVSDAEKYNGVMAFLNFILSSDVQRMHYRYQYKLPINPDLMLEVLNADSSNYAHMVKRGVKPLFVKNKLPMNSMMLFKMNESLSQWDDYINKTQSFVINGAPGVVSSKINYLILPAPCDNDNTGYLIK